MLLTISQIKEFTSTGVQFLSDFLLQTTSETLYIVLFLIVSIVLIYWPSREKWRVDKSKYLLKRLNKIEKPELIFGELRSKRVDPFLFEELILTSIQKFNPNVRITRNKKYTGDGGIDGTFVLNGVIVAIQAKKYVNEIATSHVLQLEKDMKKFGATYGLFVHTGRTRPATWNKTQGSDVFIVSGASMLALILRGKLPLELLKRCTTTTK